jgi:hypothetical protein
MWGETWSLSHSEGSKGTESVQEQSALLSVSNITVIKVRIMR